MANCNILHVGRGLDTGSVRLVARLLWLVPRSVPDDRNPAVEAVDLNARAEQLLDRHGDRVLRLAYSYMHNLADAEDILQETLIRFLRAAPTFHDESHERAWLYRVATNLCKNRLAYNARRQTDELDESLAAEDREDLSFVWEAMKSLPDKYRSVLHLHYYEGYQTAQIAKILGVKDSTVRSRLRRGRARLKDILKEAYDFEEGV